MHKKYFFVLALFAIILTSNNVLAKIYIPIDQPADNKFPVAVADLVSIEGSSAIAKQIPEIIRNDLTLSGYFAVIPKSAYLERIKNPTADTIDFKKWMMVDARALVAGVVTKEEGRLVVQLKLFDTSNKEMLVGKQYTFESKDLRRIAHRFSDEIMLSLTGIRGIFGTRIAYSGITGKRSKSIFVMDIDGENNTRLTKDKSINLGPTWSPDGSKLAFASYIDGFPNVYVWDIATGHTRQITTNRETNITPSWSPTGSMIAYASSLSGNMEIYTVTATGGNDKRVTNSFGIDISPSFSPDGNEIVYASERGGNLHIYRQPAQGGNPVRVTYVGSHNDSPSWSPDGQKVTFAGRSGGVYDIYTVNIDGTNVQRLTIGSGSNEHPRWSPDSRFITFSSAREGGKPAIYMMRYDGANQIRLNKKGEGVLPNWGPWVN